jgi:hypothetical protein
MMAILGASGERVSNKAAFRDREAAWTLRPIYPYNGILNVATVESVRSLCRSLHRRA